MTGNMLEWYDFALYSTFAGLFAKLFFPSHDPFSSLLASFGVFASGYLMRPIGSIVFGRFADRSGRSKTLLVSLVCISLPTVLMGMLPTYAQIGPLATAMLVLLRMIQGLSLGGEYTTSITWLVEQAPRNKRGFFGSWASVGAVAGFTLGTSAGVLVTLLPDATVQSWGWRLPFLLSGVLGVAGWQLRRHLTDQSSQEALADEPLIDVLWKNRLGIAQVSAFNAADTVGFYLFATYLVSELDMLMRITMEDVLRISTIGLITMLAILPLSGKLSDRFGRKRVALISPFLILLAGPGVFALTQDQTAATVLAGVLLMAMMLGVSGGVAPAWLVENTNAGSRCTILGVGYNFSSAILGGLTPLAATLLVHRTGDLLSPVWLWQSAAVLTILSILLRASRKQFLGVPRSAD